MRAKNTHIPEEDEKILRIILKYVDKYNIKPHISLKGNINSTGTKQFGSDDPI